jgi:hypothetical protein
MPFVPKATDFPGWSKFLMEGGLVIVSEMSQAASHCDGGHCKKASNLLLPQFGAPANGRHSERNVLFPGMNDIFSQGRMTRPWPR